MRNLFQPLLSRATEGAQGPGPGAYQSPRFEPRIGKDITFGRLIRPAGWSRKIKEIAPFPWELDDGDDGDHNNGASTRVGRFQAPLPRRQASNGMCCRNTHRHYRRPSSAPPSSRLRRACARGRRLTPTCTNANGGLTANKRSIADVVKEAGRRRKAQAAGDLNRRRNVTDSGAPRLFGTAPQRPLDAPTAPGPSSYRPLTLDEAARNGKVLGIGGKSGRELFPPSPDTPGPVRYGPEVIQGATVQERRTAGRNASEKAVSSGRLPATVINNRRVLEGPFIATPLQPRAGTFGTSERFPRDPSRRPGVGEYDLRTAERATKGGTSFAAGILFGHKSTGTPYVPALDRYLHSDNCTTPSPHVYRPESAAGGGGECGVGGHAPAPPAWSFGKKRPISRPPDGPGPGKFVPPYETSTTAVRFGAGRELVSGCVSGVPWVEAEERAARGEGGGRGAKHYLPRRTRLGARAFMSSRRLPRPGSRGERG